MSKKLLSVVLTALLLSVTACSAGSEPTPAGSSGNDVTVIKVARNILPNRPYSFQGDDGQFQGYTVDYLKAVDERLEQYVFEYEAVETDAMLIGTETGKYDFAANFYLRNPNREARYLFADKEYGYTINGFITKKDRTDINSIDDMAGKTLTPMNPSSGTRTIIDHYNSTHPDKPILINNIDKITDADSLKMVAAGQYDAFFTNTHTFDNVNSQLKLDLKIATLVTKEPIWLLFRKDNVKLAADINAVTEELIADGTLSELAKKWLNVDFFGTMDEVMERYKFE